MKPVISTSLLKGQFSLNDSLNIINKYWSGIVELSWIKSMQDISIVENFSFSDYIIHNYFPPPKESFILNILSSDEKTKTLSFDMVEQNLKLCQKFDFQQYHVHAGFLSEGIATQDGIIFHNKPKNKDKIEQLMITRLKKLETLSEEYNVSLCIENNTPSSVASGNISDFVVLTISEEFMHIWDQFDSLGILLDLGHLKVSSNLFNKNLKNELEHFQNLPVKALHLHDNDGLSDQHKGIGENPWFAHFIQNNSMENCIYFINESHVGLENIEFEINNTLNLQN